MVEPAQVGPPAISDRRTQRPPTLLTFAAHQSPPRPLRGILGSRFAQFGSQHRLECLFARRMDSGVPVAPTHVEVAGPRQTARQSLRTIHHLPPAPERLLQHAACPLRRTRDRTLVSHTEI